MASAWMHWAHEGSDIDIRENGALAYNASGGGQSVRSAAALPASGKHVTEFIYGREGKDDGDDLGGGFYTGVLSAAAAQRIDVMNSRDGVRNMPDGYWGCSDDGAFVHRGDGKWERAVDESLAADGDVFLLGDRVGVHVDMDARTLVMHRNGVPIPGLAFGGLPAEVYLCATPACKGSSVRIAAVAAPPVVGIPVMQAASPASTHVATKAAEVVAQVNKVDAKFVDVEEAPACLSLVLKALGCQQPALK